MKKVINGKLYNTDTAEEVASNEWRDGTNRMNTGRCATLYKTKSGQFFAWYETCWQGERDTIEPLSKNEAIEMYEQFGGDADEYEDVFGVAPEDLDNTDPAIKRLRQVRDALNKCKNQELIEKIGQVLNI